jgi:hypothetical protein
MNWEFEVKTKNGKHLEFTNNLDYAVEIANRCFKNNTKLKYVVIERLNDD